jgi:carbon-monoxide dehydrogenase medium subunit
VNSFKLINPGSKEELLKELAQKGSAGKAVAGGTDLLPAFRKEKTPVPEYMINLKSITELAVIEKTDNMVNVGALATHAEVYESPVIRENGYALGEACDKVASTQIRNLATIGGNIANASPAADSVPPMLALGAHIHLCSADGQRELKLEDFFTGPGQTVLAEDEIIEKISFPALGPKEGSAFVKLGKRKAVTLSIVSAAAYVKLNADYSLIEEARVAMGSVAPTPLRLKKAEALLKGVNPKAIDWQAFYKAVQNEVSPIGDVRSSAEYRLEVSGIIAGRALKNAIERAETSGKGGLK